MTEPGMPGMNAAIEIEAVATVDSEIMEGVERLVPQLSSTATVPNAGQVGEIVASPCTTLLIARDSAQEGRIVGSLTLAVFRIPTGVRAWIEDVVVDSTARGKGVGEALSREALRIAAARGARTVELTSRPAREAANRLYRRLGFQIRETSVYRRSLDE
jgi:ribosomal protein S18 acetylase RimI-like enzyme